MAKKRGSGEGTIVFHKAKKLWYFQVHLGYVDGKRKRKTIYGQTRKEVAEQLKVVLREQQQGLVAATGKQTVGEHLTKWLLHKKPTVRPRTYDSYESTVRVHIMPALGKLQLGKLTSDHIAALLDKKAAAGLSPRTCSYIRATLRMALGMAVERGTVPRNVATQAPAPRVERHSIRVLSPDEARLLLDAAEGDRLEALYSVALAVGLRQGEALGLHWEDVDLERAEILVHRSLQRINGKLQFVPVKTDKSRRTVSLPEETVTALRTHRIRQLEERMAAPDWDEQGLVFCTRTGRPLEKSGVTKRFPALLEKAGLPQMRFHDLRHSCASLLLAQGVPLKVVQEVLGHSSIMITGDIYAHLMPDAKREAATMMGQILRKKG